MQQVEKDVEYLKAQMTVMTSTQEDIRDSIKTISTAIAEILMLRKSHDYHETEIMKLRELSHSHASSLQKSMFEIEALKKLGDRVKEVEKSENNIRISQAKNGVIITIVTTCIVILLTKIIKGVW